jgi:hypothetical protein
MSYVGFLLLSHCVISIGFGADFMGLDTSQKKQLQ